MRHDLSQPKVDDRTTLLWCGDRFDCDALLARRDFPHLQQALHFVQRQLPLGRRLTVWAIAGHQLIPPEGVAALCDGLAA